MADALFCSPFYQAERPMPIGCLRKTVIVKIKTAGEAPAVIQRKRTYNGPRKISMVMKCLSHSSKLWRQRRTGEILGPSLKRVESGQHRGMRGIRQRDLRDGTFENDSIFGQGIDGCGAGTGGTVASDVVGANRIDRNQNDIGPGVGWRNLISPSGQNCDRNRG